MMTKTEAARTVALDIAVFARRTNQVVTPLAIAESFSEMANGHKGGYKAEAAQIANTKTVKRFVRESLNGTGHYHLIGF